MSVKAKWKPFPETAPKDRPILVRGKWKPFDILPGGETEVVVVEWSTLKSNDTEYDWYVTLGILPLKYVEVDFIEWTDIPD